MPARGIDGGSGHDAPRVDPLYLFIYLPPHFCEVSLDDRAADGRRFSATSGGGERQKAQKLAVKIFLDADFAVQEQLRGNKKFRA